MDILHIDCSPRQESHSRKLSAAIIERIVALSPSSRIVRRDLAASPVPNPSSDYATTLSSPATLAAPLTGALDLSESLIREVEDADVIVIGTPMNNFTVPSVLKAWIDQVLRANRTFMSTSQGKIGLLRDRPVLIGIASGAVFSGERANQPDFLTPYLSAVFECMGLRSLQFIAVQATAYLDDQHSMSARKQALDSLKLALVGERALLAIKSR